MIGSYVLSKMAEYDYMFSVSKNCCWFFSCPMFPCCLTSALSPIIHRTLIFTVLDKNGDEEGAQKLKEIFDVVNKNEENLQKIASRHLQGETPLIISIKEHKPKCATVLLNNGAKIEENRAGEYPVNIAVRNKDIDMLKVLLANGGKIKEDKSGLYPVNIAIRNMDIDTMKLLLANGGEIKEDKSGEYPVNISVRNKDIDMVKFLLVKGGEIKKDTSGEHPVKVALSHDDHEMLIILLENVENLDDVTKKRHLNYESKVGTIHTIVKQTLMLNVLENSQLVEDMKLKIVKTFKKAGIPTIPVDNIAPNSMSKVQKLVQVWNTEHNEAQVDIGQRKLFDNDCILVTVRTSSTDKETSMGGEKIITAVEVKWVDGYNIHQMRLKYGEDWGDWHKTGYKPSGEENVSVFLLQEGEMITSVKTTYSEYGMLYYLGVETSAGRKWEQHTESAYPVERGDFSAPDRRLGYVTTADGGDSWYPNYQIVFHWV